MCPQTAIYVSSYCYVWVLILPYMCPHTSIHVSSYCYICVLTLLYICHLRDAGGAGWSGASGTTNTVRASPPSRCCVSSVLEPIGVLKRVIFFFPQKLCARPLVVRSSCCVRAASEPIDCCVRAHETHALKEAVGECCISAYFSAHETRALSGLRLHTQVD